MAPLVVSVSLDPKERNRRQQASGTAFGGESRQKSLEGMTEESITQLTAKVLEELLNENDIQGALNARRPPSCPASWKASYLDRALGKDAPWGDFNLAWTFFRMGKIEVGRELLRRLCKHQPTDRDNLALGAFEFLHEPEDRAESRRLLDELSRLFPAACELYALRSIGTFDRSPRFAYESYCNNNPKPAGPLGTFLNDLQEVCISFTHHQVLFCEVGTDISSVIVQPLPKGVALLLLRRQLEALSIFATAYRDAEQMPDSYMRHFGPTLTQSQRESVARMIQITSLKGLQLALFDLGLDDFSKAVEELYERERG